MTSTFLSRMQVSCKSCIGGTGSRSSKSTTSTSLNSVSPTWPVINLETSGIVCTRTGNPARRSMTRRRSRPGEMVRSTRETPSVSINRGNSDERYTAKPSTEWPTRSDLSSTNATGAMLPWPRISAANRAAS